MGLTHEKYTDINVLVSQRARLRHRIRNLTRRDTSLMLGGSADIGLHTPARERRPCS